MKKTLTLDDIAAQAGVSRATASRVLNDRPHVRDEVRARVWQVIQETGYQPHPVARSLASQRTGIIGLVIPRTTEGFFTDPYFPHLTQGIAYTCNEHDYIISLFLIQTQEDERKLYPRISQGLLDGVIVQVGAIGDQFINALLQGTIPSVVAGRPQHHPEANYVDVDNIAGAYNAVMHLLQLGRKRVATITGDMGTTAGLDREKGYRRALMKRGIPIEPDLIMHGDFTEISGYYGMQRLLSHKPDAVFAGSDTMAMGAMRAIKQAGLSVPEDIAIVGYDDLPPARMASPPLTTIRQPIHRFGVKAVEILLDVIENGKEPPRQIVFDTKLIVRESCGSSVNSQ